jgi:predicted peroxiredoxin
MGENTPQEYKQLTREDLEALAGEELPERAAMSLINANIAAPINAAVALNVASDNSVAYANAEQTGDITQSNWTTREEIPVSEYKKLSKEELSELAGEELPERAAMSLINANIAIPVNAAVAANVLSDGAIAYADATQSAPIDQSN